jgi:hypothetical protein
MFLVKRKSDGLYWRNLDYHQRRRKENWQSSPYGIVPFKSEVGARNAMNPFCFIPYKESREMAGGCCGFPLCSKHERQRINLIKKRFDTKFEIVPVEVRL